MMEHLVPSRQQYQEAVDFIRQHSTHCQNRPPRIGIILGSGLSPLADSIQGAERLPFAEIPYMAPSTVQGHTGQMVIGQLEGQSVIVMQGRLHYYEGYSMQQVTWPVRVLCLLGIEILIVTNAAGGLAPQFHPGELMLIHDHINLIGMAGLNPLIGPNDPDFGPRFPDMSQAYDSALRQAARQVAQEQNIPLHEGVYICLAGPSFETPADIRFLRGIGADAVGMSTVPEVTVARHMGVRVLGISGISNVLSTSAESAQQAPTTHQEVLEAGRVIVPRLTHLIQGFLKRL